MDALWFLPARCKGRTCLRERLKNRRGWNVVAHTRAMEAALESMARA